MFIANLWIASVGPRYFETFDVPLIAGRDFHDGDRNVESRVVLVNEAFSRQYFGGASPVGRRVRYVDADTSKAQPWFEIVGMVRDIGMTPTDGGEAPYLYTPASPASTSPMVMGVRVDGDPAAFAARVRPIAANLDAGLRLDEVRGLDDIVWSVDVPMMAGAGAIVSVVTLALCLSSAGIFALMSVTIPVDARDWSTTALGARRGR